VSGPSRPGATTPRFADGLGPRTVIPAVWDVLSAAAAKASGATHLFLSGAAVNNVRGYPDRGLLDIDDIARVVKEIVTAVDLPLLVDAETGFGPLPRLARLLDELIRAGAAGVLIEDQDETGQSKSLTTPGLCDPEVMCERLHFTRTLVGDALGVLARTDYLPTMEFDESLRRLSMYDGAGCDWVIPVFAPSREALAEAAARFPGRLMVLAASPPISGVMRYSPTRQDLEAVNPVGILVTGQYRNAYQSLRRAYSLTFDGEWATLFAERPEPVGLDVELGLNRPGMNR
jgi:2-methylisocitrate lyase-like PEP mutase family enzyme